MERSQIRELKTLSLGAILREVHSSGVRMQLKSPTKSHDPWICSASWEISKKKSGLSPSAFGP
jgi:hypothetical protein